MAHFLVIFQRTRPGSPVPVIQTPIYNPVKKKLEDIGLSIHPPGEKTKPSVDIAKGELEFVGFQFFEDKIRARPSTVRKFKERFRREVIEKEPSFKSASPKLLARHTVLVHHAINPKVEGPEPEICGHCGLPKDRRRNWMSYFANTVTDIHQIKELDRWMRAQVSKHFRKKYKRLEPQQRIKRKDWQRAGAITLEREYHRQRRMREKLCRCSEEAFPGDNDVH